MTKEKQTKIKKIFSNIRTNNFLHAGNIEIKSDIQTIKDNLKLFFGISVSVYALLNFSSNKYCDGNTATYHSCTNPTTYYFYETSTILLFIFGIFLVTLWYLKRNS